MPILQSALTLADLPSPPDGKTGFPWTEQSQPLPDRLPDGSEYPRISVVTPSYNQGMFLEETIRSVLLQGYPNLEYIIMDGGSTDNSVEIIKKYEPYLAYWVSESDRGQSHALNKGFHLATGDLIGWQNSDDYYASNAFAYAAQASLHHKDVDIIYGSLNSVDLHSCFIQTNYVSEFNLLEMMPWANMFNQSMFFSKRIFQDQHYINESFHHYMDLEFFWRLALTGYKFHLEPKLSAYFRLHQDTKGSRQYDIAAKEAILIYRTIYQNSHLPQNVRKKALHCAQEQCVDCFGKMKLTLFQECLQSLLTTGGLWAITPAITLRYLVSLLGSEKTQHLKSIRRQLTRTPLQSE